VALCYTIGFCSCTREVQLEAETTVTGWHSTDFRGPHTGTDHGRGSTENERVTDVDAVAAAAPTRTNWWFL